MRPAADTTAGARAEGWSKPFHSNGPAGTDRIRGDESDAKKGYLYQIPNTFLRRCAMVLLVLAATAFVLVLTATFSIYAAAMSLGSAAREFAGEFAIHFHGTRRGVRIIRLAIGLAWDREAVSNPDAARERMQARAKRWRK